MKFMVSFRVHEDKRHEVLKAFSQMTAQDDQADMGERGREEEVQVRLEAVTRKNASSVNFLTRLPKPAKTSRDQEAFV